MMDEVNYRDTVSTLMFVKHEQINHFHPGSALNLDPFSIYPYFLSLRCPSWVILPSSFFLLLFFVRDRVEPFFLKTKEEEVFLLAQFCAIYCIKPSSSIYSLKSYWILADSSWRLQLMRSTIFSVGQIHRLSLLQIASFFCKYSGPSFYLAYVLLLTSERLMSPLDPLSLLFMGSRLGLLSSFSFLKGDLWVGLGMLLSFFNLDWESSVSPFIKYMNKRSDNNISTQRILKSKYLERDKQKTIPLLKSDKSKNKIIRLVDLCPQEKLKIGELIKTLENRRIENVELSDEVKRLKSTIVLSQEEIERLSEQCEEKQRLISSLNEEIDILRSSLQESRQKNEEMAETVKEYARAIERKAKTSNKRMQTEGVLKEEKSVGIEREVRQIDVQTEKEKQQTRDLFYRPHSKSFEKIMKGTLLNIEMTQTRPNDISQSRTKSRHTSNFTDKVRQSGGDSAENDDDFIEQLHLKWDQLKAKNRNMQDNSPHSFNASTEKESSWHKSKMQEIDEISLNKMLRLKDFSASKLMRMGKEVSSSKRSQQSPEVNYLKSPYFNRLQPQQSHPKKLPPPKRTPNSEQQINFYQSGLFDLQSSKQ